MRKTLSVAALLVFTWAGQLSAADAPLVLDLWPDKVPGETASIGDEKMEGEKGSRRVSNVSRPTITVYRPAKDKQTDVAVIIAPGGGYNILAWDHEGEDVAAWLNSLGVTGVLLKYRVPKRDEHPKHPLQDAQRALGLVRSKAKEWALDDKKIGVLGFSAGGHLAAVAATNYGQRAYDAIDDADKLSCRPDFAVMIYAGGIVSRGASELIPDVKVTKDSPPTFLVHCSDDRGSAEQSALMYLALKRAGVPAELHIYSTGGHGFGLRPNKGPVSDWPRRCEDWLRSQGVLQVSTAK
jgi:acetyl esterase/lipase